MQIRTDKPRPALPVPMSPPLVQARTSQPRSTYEVDHLADYLFRHDEDHDLSDKWGVGLDDRSTHYVDKNLDGLISRAEMTAVLEKLDYGDLLSLNRGAEIVQEKSGNVLHFLGGAAAAIAGMIPAVTPGLAPWIRIGAGIAGAAIAALGAWSWMTNPKDKAQQELNAMLNASIQRSASEAR